MFARTSTSEATADPRGCRTALIASAVPQAVEAEFKRRESATRQFAKQLARDEAESLDEAMRRVALAAAQDASRQREVALALMSQSERDRADEIHAKLNAEGFWALTPNEVNFAYYGVAGPLFHDEIHKVAAVDAPERSRCDIAKTLGLGIDERIALAARPNSFYAGHFVYILDKIKEGRSLTDEEARRIRSEPLFAEWLRENLNARGTPK